MLALAEFDASLPGAAAGANAAVSRLQPDASSLFRCIIEDGQALGPELDAEAIPPHEVKYPLLLSQHLSLPLVTSLKLALVSKND
eukprot:gene15175-21247_t